MIPSLEWFLRDRRASLATEFVIGMPLLLAAQAIAFDVGRIIMDQHALEAGVRDASRYLARAPTTDFTSCPTSGARYQAYNTLVTASVRSDIVVSDIQCQYVELTTESNPLFRTPYRVVEIIAEVEVETPLLGVLDGVTVAAMGQSRYTGE